MIKDGHDDAMHAEVKKIMDETNFVQIFPEMSDEEFDAQTRLYSGHHFTTLRGKRIRINDKMTLKEAIANHKRVKKELETATRIGHFIRPHEENEQLLKELRETEEVFRAQAMAAFCRFAGCWPKDAKDALGF